MTPTRFRQVLLCYVVATAAGLVAMWFPQYSQALAGAYAGEPIWFAHASTATTILLVAFAVAVLIAMIAATAGLFLFRSWARRLSLWLTVLGVLLMPFTGVSLAWGLEAALWELSTVLWGALLAAAYWSPVGTAFGDHPAQARAQAAL